MLRPRHGTPSSSQRRPRLTCHRHPRRAAAQTVSSTRMMTCVTLATLPGAPVVCTCVPASPVAASSTRTRAGNASKLVCARKMARASPRPTSALLSAWSRSA
eukprot:15179284-Alexandrium_andersonii.AAC.1